MPAGRQPSGKTGIVGILLSGPILGDCVCISSRNFGGGSGRGDGFHWIPPSIANIVWPASWELRDFSRFGVADRAWFFFLVAWIFIFLLIIDKGLGFWQGMEASRKIVSRHWWKCFEFRRCWRW